MFLISLFCCLFSLLLSFSALLLCVLCVQRTARALLLSLHDLGIDLVRIHMDGVLLFLSPCPAVFFLSVFRQNPPWCRHNRVFPCSSCFFFTHDSSFPSIVAYFALVFPLCPRWAMRGCGWKGRGLSGLHGGGRFRRPAEALRREDGVLRFSLQLPLLAVLQRLRRHRRAFRQVRAKRLFHSLFETASVFLFYFCGNSTCGVGSIFSPLFLR